MRCNCRQRIRNLYRFACGDFLPDRTLVLVLDEEQTGEGSAIPTVPTALAGGPRNSTTRYIWASAWCAASLIACGSSDMLPHPRKSLSAFCDNLADLLP